jgi:hypothetical protein
MMVKGGCDSRLELPRPEIVVDDIDQIKINDEIFTGLEITPTDVTDVDKKLILMLVLSVLERMNQKLLMVLFI